MGVYQAIFLEVTRAAAQILEAGRPVCYFLIMTGRTQQIDTVISIRWDQIYSGNCEYPVWNEVLKNYRVRGGEWTPLKALFGKLRGEGGAKCQRGSCELILADCKLQLRPGKKGEKKNPGGSRSPGTRKKAKSDPGDAGPREEKKGNP